MRSAMIAVGVCLVASLSFAQDIASSVDAEGLAEKKRTGLGLYLTPADAAAALDADPSIVFVDVRDPIEINFIGHPEPVDAIVPYETASLDFDAAASGYGMVPNPDFVRQIEALVARLGRGPDDALFIICRSGGRSAEAVDVLADAGFTNAWNLVEGFEGDKDDAGARAVNGWRNAGLPWTYKIRADAAWPPVE